MFKKPISTKEGGILAALFRKIVTENNLTPSLDYLIARYVDTSSSSKNIKRKNRSSLIKYITSDDMSWKTFLSLVFDFLGVVKIQFTVKLTFRNKHESIHTMIVNNDILEKDKDDNTGNKQSESGSKEKS